MDDDDRFPKLHNMITQLRLEAGRIMENTCDELASRLPADRIVLAGQLNEHRQAAEDIQALLAAAHVLHRRCVNDDQS